MLGSWILYGLGRLGGHVLLGRLATGEGFKHSVSGLILHEEARGAIAADLARLQELWAQGLERHGGPFLAGPSFSAVDAFYAPIAFRWQTYGFPLGEKAADYARRLLSLASMREWERDALAETWRDAAHDAEAPKSGEIIEDLRAR